MTMTGTWGRGCSRTTAQPWHALSSDQEPWEWISSLDPQGSWAFQKAIHLYKQLSCENIAQRQHLLWRRAVTVCTHECRGSCKFPVLSTGQDCPNSSTKSLVTLQKSGLIFLFCICQAFAYLEHLNGKPLSAAAEVQPQQTNSHFWTWSQVGSWFPHSSWAFNVLSHVRTVLSEWQKDLSGIRAPDLVQQLWGDVKWRQRVACLPSSCRDRDAKGALSISRRELSLQPSSCRTCCSQLYEYFCMQIVGMLDTTALGNSVKMINEKTNKNSARFSESC